MNFALNNKTIEEVGYNYVVAGGFEDRPEQLNKECYYRVHLNSNDHTYFATDAEINEAKADINELLYPTEELSRSGYMVYYPRWTFNDANGVHVEAMADMMDVTEKLFEQGGLFVRAARFVFENLQYRYPQQDWTPFTLEKASEIIEPLGEHGAYTQIYVVEDEFTSRRTAKRAMRRDDYFNLGNVSRELFAHCAE